MAIVATSSVHAVDESNVLRGAVYKKKDSKTKKGSRSSSSKCDKKFDGDGTSALCIDGRKDGKQTVDDLWKSMDENCDNAWGLEEEANKEKDRKYPCKADNKEDQEYNDCARYGVDQQVQRIEKECFDDDPSQCQDLGETAAEIIVFANVNCSVASSSTYGNDEPDYKETCREVAYGICSGYISTTINKYCSGSNVSTSELLELQKKCEKQVDNMVGNGSDELKIMIK